MQVRNKLRRSVKRTIKDLQERGSLPAGSFGKIKIERPQRDGQGDYATSIAMQIASFANRKPKTIAKILTKELKNDSELAKMFKDIQVASPGFINFYFADEYVGKLLLKLVKDDRLGAPDVGKGKKINFEFISVNPTGQLHIGHGRAAFFGDSLARILSFAGFDLVREYYINNARQSAQIKELGKTALKRGTSYKSPYLDKKLREFSKSLSRMKNSEAAGYFLANKIQKDIKDFLAKKAKIKFDVWTEEEYLYKKRLVAETFRELKNKNLTYENDGAVWLKTTKYGDTQDQVLVRQNGENTYFMADIAYHTDKAKRGFDKMIDIWGADHQGHVKRMGVALRMFGIKKFEILITQIVRLKGRVKLSKRKGNIVALEDLIDDIGLDSTRYFYLTKSLNSQMEIDLNLARMQNNKNPVFYIQYTHARICSILRKSKTLIASTAFGARLSDKYRLQEINKKTLDKLGERGEFDLAKKLLAFGDIIEDIAQDYQVHRLTTYVYELAHEFNQFYRDFRVIEGRVVNEGGLALTMTTGLVIKQCLDLLGIGAPEKM